MISVQPIPVEESIPWLKQRHYARRLPCICFAFAAFREKSMIGVVTYGVPASPHLCRGICGAEWADKVLELNRLCCENTKNVASIIVGRSLQMLPKPRIVVSYADTKQGHVGYVYQATNFLYTGLTDSERKTPRGDRVGGAGHSRHEGRLEDGSVNPELAIVRRLPKHRYVFACGNRKEREAIQCALRYPILPFPKGETKRYDASAEILTQMAL